MFTANDAYTREFNIVAPRDCLASSTEVGDDDALELIERVLKGDTRPAHAIDFAQLQKTSQEDASKPEVQTPEFASPN